MEGQGRDEHKRSRGWFMGDMVLESFGEYNDVNIYFLYILHTFIYYRYFIYTIIIHTIYYIIINNR